MNCLNFSTAQALTEREQKIKNYYEGRIEQLNFNSSANAILKDAEISNVKDSLHLVKNNLTASQKTLLEVSKKANKYQTFFFICLVLIAGLGFIVSKLLTKGRFI